MNYYQRHIGDYRRDTGHLSHLEHGIYIQMLDWMYLEEKPIPLETHWVMRRLRIETEAEISAFNNVLNDFFEKTDDGWIQHRVAREIAKYHEMSGKNRENGRKGGRPAKAPSEPTKNPVGFQPVYDGFPFATQSEPSGNPNQEPITNNQESIPNRRESSRFVGARAKERNETNPSPLLPDERRRLDRPIADVVLDAAGMLEEVAARPRMMMGVAQTVARWEAMGWDLNLDILPTIQSVSAQMTADGEPARTIAVFEKWIAGAYARRTTVKSAQPAQPAKSKQETRAELLAWHRANAKADGCDPDTELGLRKLLMAIAYGEWKSTWGSDPIGNNGRTERSDIMIPAEWLASHLSVLENCAALVWKGGFYDNVERLARFMGAKAIPAKTADELPNPEMGRLCDEYLKIDPLEPPRITPPTKASPMAAISMTFAQGGDSHLQ